MNLKPLFNRAYFTYMFFKIGALVCMILAVYFFMVAPEPQMMLAILIFILGIFASFKQSSIKPVPPLADCLKDSNIFVSIYASISMTVGLAVLCYAIFERFATLQVSLFLFLATTLGLFLSGAALYMRECKKCGIFK